MVVAEGRRRCAEIDHRFVAGQLGQAIAADCSPGVVRLALHVVEGALRGLSAAVIVMPRKAAAEHYAGGLWQYHDVRAERLPDQLEKSRLAGARAAREYDLPAPIDVSHAQGTMIALLLRVRVSGLRLHFSSTARTARPESSPAVPTTLGRSSTRACRPGMGLSCNRQTPSRTGHMSRRYRHPRDSGTKDPRTAMGSGGMR